MSEISYPTSRLRKHADYQRVYAGLPAGITRKQHTKHMSYFFTLRPATPHPIHNRQPELSRVGLTVPKVLGKAVDRNRIKRRLRAAIRQHLALLSLPVDAILHPRRTVLTAEWTALEREVAQVFRSIQRDASKLAAPREASHLPLLATLATPPPDSPPPAQSSISKPPKSLPPGLR